jgi:hypothetical protein
MRTLKTLLTAFITITCVASCSKKNDAATTPSATTVEVTVTDGSSGSTSTGATVSLYESTTAVTNNTPKYTQATDQTGKAKITVDFLSQYYIVVQKGTAKNFYSGLIPVGLFKSAADIAASPIQSPAGAVGGVKYQDSNGDGKIDKLDYVNPPAITLKANTNTTAAVTIY